MSTRRFEAATTPAALRAVRVAFGEEAFILSNRRTERGVEIIASRSDVGVPDAHDPVEPAYAADAGKDREERGGAPRTTRISIESLLGMASSPVEQPTEERASGAGDEQAVSWPGIPAADDRPSDVAPAAAPRPVTASAPAPESAAAPVAEAPAPAATTIDLAAIDAAVRAAVHESLAQRLPEPVDTEARATQIAVATAASLSDSAEQRLQRIEVALWGKEDKQRAHLLDRLLRLGLGAAVAVRLAEQARGENIEMLMRDALARLRNSLPILRNAGTGAQGVLGVKLLSGPDSDARMASMLQFARAAIALEGPRSVVLVSADTERTGAFSLLEECARELGCVAVRVRRVDDLETTLLGLSDRACVLVDAGNAWPHSASDHQRLLVLPATLQRGACATSIKAARDGQADGCVLCSLQSAGRPGEALEALIDHWLPIAFWSDSDASDSVPRRAEAALVVAAAIGAARRLGSSEHDRLLGALMHPGQYHQGAGFMTAVRIPSEAERRARRPLGESLGGVPTNVMVQKLVSPATTASTGEVAS